MLLFCSNQVELTVFKYIVCTNKLLVQSLVYTSQKVVKQTQYNFSLLISKCTYTVFKNECTQFKNNVPNSRTVFSTKEQCFQFKDNVLGYLSLCSSISSN